MRIASRKYLGSILRLVIAAGILYLIARHVGPQAILQRLKQAQVIYLVGACALIVAYNFTRIWNWQQILRGLGIRTPHMFRNLAACYFSGGFLGTIIPSTAGTDALRAIFAAYLFRGDVAFYSGPIVTLNILGLFAGCCLGLLGVATASAHGYPATFLNACIFVFSAIVLGAITVHLALKYRRGLMLRLLRLFKSGWLRFRRVARTFIGTLRVFTRQHVRFTPVVAVALSDQFLRAMTFLLIAKAVDVQLSVAVCLIVVPLTTLVAIIPFSIAGYGGEQAALVYLLAPFGISAAEAVTVSLTAATLFLLSNVVVGGGVFLLSAHRLRPPADGRPASEPDRATP